MKTLRSLGRFDPIEVVGAEILERHCVAEHVVGDDEDGAAILK